MYLINSQTKKIIFIKPIFSYYNPYEQRKEIYKETCNKTGLYIWTNNISGKSYVGSAVNLTRRLRNYLSLAHLNLELKTKNSLIYKALIKYNYSSFRLDILEICNQKEVLMREQYYLDNYIFEYNILKIAGSLLGFRHSTYTKERLRIIKLGKPCPETVKKKLSANSQAFSLKVENIKTKEVLTFTSIRRTAIHINIHNSYLAKCLREKQFYKGRGYYITKN